MNRRLAILLAAGAAMMFVALGTRQGFGLFLAPVGDDLGLGREVFGFAIALQNLIWGLAQPVTGMISDRWGPARVMAVCAVLYGAGLVLMANATGPASLFGGAGLLVGLGLSGVTFAVVLGAVGRAAPAAWRSTALGVVSAGGSAGQFLLTPGSQGLISWLGWSPALLVLAGAVFLVTPLAAAFARPKAAAAGPVAGDTGQGLGRSLVLAARHRGYLCLTAGFFVCGFHVTFIMVHLPAFITDSGLPAWTGATALAAIGFFNIVGTFLFGALGDRYRKKYLLGWLYLLRAVAIGGFLLLPVSTNSVLVFASVMGVLWLATVPLTSGLVAQIFGTRYMTTLFGVVFLSHQVGAFLGAWGGGLVYDATGSYDAVWIVAVALGIVAALLHLPIADRPVAGLADGAPAGP